MYRYRFSLRIMASRRSSQNFDSYDEFVDEVSSHFSSREHGIVEYLTTFPEDRWSEPVDGWQTQQKDWQYYYVTADRYLVE